MDMANNTGLKPETINKINEVFNKYFEIKEAVLYGSRAQGNYQYNSDIDLTLKGEGLNLTLLQKIETDLDDLLLPYKIDLSIYDSITNPDLIEHINRVGKVFYKRRPCFETHSDLNKETKGR